MNAPLADLVACRLRDVADFPAPGILFKDIAPLLADGAAFGAVVRDVASRHPRVDLVAGIEARGFVLGAAVAHRLGVGFLPVRKAGKLPGSTLHADYDLEYGTARIEVQADAVRAGARVVLVDDVLATGGTALAAWQLLGRAGADVVAFETVVELSFLLGRARLGARTVHSVLTV
ncbi:MAG TPA: adenine phosphoribosyltransferase [Dermatophilaceae bacterium]|nr:adenine phosphoribosyltransferase [Dermatophilaceae bacterium]